MTHFRVIRELIELGDVPVAQVTVTGAKVTVELIDGHRRMLITFAPFQALRVTTADCFVVPNGIRFSPRAVFELKSSDWIEALAQSLETVDSTADFMNKSRHFLIPSVDDVIEVAAWNIMFDA